MNETLANENSILEKKTKYLKLLQDNEELNEIIRKRQEILANLDFILKTNLVMNQNFEKTKTINLNGEMSSSDTSTAMNTINTLYSPLTNTTSNNKNNIHFNFEIQQVENCDKVKNHDKHAETEF